MVIFFAATFTKNWGTAVSENLLEKFKPEVSALRENPARAKVRCPAIQNAIQKHLPELEKSTDKSQVPLAHKLIADCAFAADNFAVAAEQYKKLTTFEPNFAGWHAKLAESYLKAGEFGDALSPSILATQLAPEDFKIRRLNARVLVALGLRNRAISAYAEAIKLAPYKMIAPTQKELASVLAESERDDASGAAAVGN